MKKVLHVGCGQKSIPQMPLGFQDGEWTEVRFDINESVRPDIIGTITNMVDVEDSSVDALFSSHNIEHVFPHEVVGVLSEFRRVIKKDGFVVVTCPDLQEVCKNIAEGNGAITKPLYQSTAGTITPLDILYGHIASVSRGEIYMAHKTGFDLQSLGGSFKEAGFARYLGYRNPGAYELWMIGFNEEKDSEQGNSLMREFCGNPPRKTLV
ncbi:MAG: SAM-dependent methyltransferase [Planctomycetota bacterium]|jgi:SAM-dependent methyltransferase